MRKAELNRLKATLGVLKNKTQFLPKQANFYDRYNEHVGSRRKNWRHSSRFLRSGFAASIRRSRRSQQPHGSSASAASSQRCNGSSMVAAEEGGAATSAGCGAGAAVVKPIGPFRFTSREMYEKGVLLSIQGLSTDKLKDVLLEFKATEETGVFDVAAWYTVFDRTVKCKTFIAPKPLGKKS